MLVEEAPKEMQNVEEGNVEEGRRIQENQGEENVRKVKRNVVKRKVGEEKRNLVLKRKMGEEQRNLVKVEIEREKDQEENLKRKETEAGQRDQERIVFDKQMTLPAWQTLPRPWTTRGLRWPTSSSRRTELKGLRS